MKSPRLVLAIVLCVLMLLAACEPLAPPEPGQSVIVITNTPTEVIPVSPTPLLGTPLPTQAPASPTPENTVSPTVSPQPTLPECSTNEGLLFDTTFSSDIAGDEIRYDVYLPPCFYESGRRFPYIILLHGSGYSETQWTEGIGLHTLLEEGLAEQDPEIAPMVLIMPYGGARQEENLFAAGESWEDIILTELIPAVENSFCVWNEDFGRAIGGISRGGFWATSISMRNPGIFMSMGGHSPAYFDDNAPATHNPLDLAAIVSPTIPLRIYLDIARPDSSAENVGQFSNSLSSRGVRHVYEVSPTGGHNNDYWSAQALNYLKFYSEPWPKNIAELPSCF